MFIAPLKHGTQRNLDPSYGVLFSGKNYLVVRRTSQHYNYRKLVTLYYNRF